MNVVALSEQLQSVQPDRAQLDAEHMDIVLRQLFPEFNPWWRDDAACRTMDPETFHLSRGDRGRLQALVVGVCGKCPVRTECISNELREFNGTEMHGIAGGMAPRNRQKVLSLVRKRDPVTAIEFITTAWRKADAKLGAAAANAEPYFPHLEALAEPSDGSFAA